MNSLHKLTKSDPSSGFVSDNIGLLFFSGNTTHDDFAIFNTIMQMMILDVNVMSARAKFWRPCLLIQRHLHHPQKPCI
jgi:hypothetical protein